MVQKSFPFALCSVNIAPSSQFEMNSSLPKDGMEIMATPHFHSFFLLSFTTTQFPSQLSTHLHNGNHFPKITQERIRGQNHTHPFSLLSFTSTQFLYHPKDTLTQWKALSTTTTITIHERIRKTNKTAF